MLIRLLLRHLLLALVRPLVPALSAVGLAPTPLAIHRTLLHLRIVHLTREYALDPAESETLSSDQVGNSCRVPVVHQERPGTLHRKSARCLQRFLHLTGPYGAIAPST